MSKEERLSASRLCSKFLTIAFSFLLLVGFRVFPIQERWNVNTTDQYIWVEFCSRPTITKNDLPGEDPLTGQAIDFTSLTQSIFDDYNSIDESYIRLADAETDVAYDPNLAVNRTIHVCFGDLPIGRGGQAGYKLSANHIIDCTITLRSSSTDSAKGFVRTLTHEIGHCMGLDHAQDSTRAVMSYFNDSSTPRLQIDDKMGMVYLYPTHPEAARESASLGFSCSPR